MTTPLRPYAFVLAVRDLDANLAYFRDVLGFAPGWSDPGNWEMVARGEVRVMLGRCPDAAPARDTGDHAYFGYLHADDVDALHAEIAARGALVLAPPADRPWGMREMHLATPEGHRLVIGQHIS